MKVFKWELKVAAIQDIRMPIGAVILTVQNQRGVPYIWAKCEERTGLETVRRIYIVRTGHPMSTDIGKYIGTFQQEDGALVFHVFESRTRQ